jgi:hypothetical protein
MADLGTPIRVSGVLRFRDDRTGSLAELAVRPSTPLRVCIHGRSASAKSRLGDLRVLLVADVLRRVAELGGQQVMAVLVTADLSSGALEHDASALGIYPPTARAGPEEAEALLRGSAHVHVAANADGLGDRVDAVLVGVGPVENLTHREPDDAGGVGADGHDLLALRLALLSCPHGQPVQLTDAVLADAETWLGRWRRQVAEWANEPSKPIPAEIAQKIGVAFNDDLDTTAALAVLHRVESDDGLSPGAKFETFAFADRVLALELVREIGR